LAYLLEDIAGLAAGMGQDPTAARRALQLVAAAAQLRSEIGAPLSTAEQAKLDHLIEPARHLHSQAADDPAPSLDQVMDDVMTWAEPARA
jgi:hypothetical protein